MHFDTQDVVAALASPAGSAARAIIRVSGSGCQEIVTRIFTANDSARWMASRASQRHPGVLQLSELDAAIKAEVLLWPTNRSYTGETLIELHLPGSPPLVEAALAALFACGTRPARPGEFTLRAFLAGRLDLMQAEAVLGVIDAHDHQELEIALRQLAGGLSGRLAEVRRDLLSLLADLEAGLDFVDEDIEFVTRQDVQQRTSEARTVIAELLADSSKRSREDDRPRVVLAGLPNAGKSTLFNTFCGGTRAIVSPVAGTTRDWLTAQVTLLDVPVELIDTAGWETASDELLLAMQSVRSAQLERADLIVWCTASDLTATEQQQDQQLRDQLGTLRERSLFLITKADLAASHLETGAVSATTGQGLPGLRRRIVEIVHADGHGVRQLVGSTISRGRQSLIKAHDALERLLAALELGFGDDVLAAELRESLDALAAVLGVIYTDDVLDVIFSRFCIGK